MLHLTYANRTEALAACLAGDLAQVRAAAGPWAALPVVVPNPAMRAYVRGELARHTGMAANLRFLFLDGLGRELLGKGEARILSAARLQAGLLQALGDRAFLAGPGLDAVRDYLAGDAGGMKRVQLASELAKLFEEYHHGRPEWIRAWREDRRAPGADPAREPWQRALWRRAVACVDAAGAPHETLEEAVRAGRLGKAELPCAFFVFGFSHVAQAYHAVFRALGEQPGTELHLYALNPCAEFWEDLRTERERAQARPRRDEARLGPARLQAAPEDPDEDLYRLSLEGPEALRRWGRPGRENIRLLNEASGCDFRPAFALPEGDSLLARIQTDILLFKDPEPSSAAPDGSVRFLAAPGPRREAEIVATEIWRLMEAHRDDATPLRFSDIAVIVPPAAQEGYLAHLQAAFLETGDLPWSQEDGPSPVLGRVLEAAELLLELPTSGLTRAAVLRVLGHPALGRRPEAPFAGAWARWCGDLGIVRGLDRRAWEGSYLDREALHWDQGLKRLALGAFLEEGCAFALDGARYTPRPVADLAAGGAFLEAARRLLEEASELGGSTRPLRAWVDRISAFLEAWIAAEDEAATRAFARVRAALEGLREAVPEAGAPVAFAAARFLAQEALAGLRRRSPGGLSRGVVVSSYTPMRAIPFRAVFLLGLGEGSFPTRDLRHPLDMRGARRLPGDVSQTEKEGYLFLETLLSAREHLVLSYVALDEMSGEALEPSGLHKAFRGLVGRSLGPAWAPGGDGDPLLERHPLRRFDPGYFPAWFPGTEDRGLRSYAPVAREEARAAWMREQLAGGRPLELPPALGLLPAPPGTRARLAQLLGACPIEASAEATGDFLRLGLSELRAWLECPLTGAALVRAGLRREAVEDRAAVEDEPFAHGGLEAWSLPRAAALEVLREGASPEEAYDAALQRLQDRAEAPFGLYAAGPREAHLAAVRAWVAHLAPERPEQVRFGACGGGGTAARQQPPLALQVPLEGRTLRVELAGELRPQSGGSLFLEDGAPPTASGLAGLRRKALAAYLDHLVLAAAEPGHGGHAARFVFAEAKKGGRELRYAFRPLAPGEAEARLAAWVRELLEGDHAVLMPIEAVLELGEDLDPEALRAWVDRQEGRGFSTLRGPVPAPLRHAPPPDPLALARARYGDFLDQVAGEPEEVR